MEAVRSNLEQTDKAPRRNIAVHTCVGTTYYVKDLMHKEEALLNFPKSCHGGNYCQDPNRAKPCLPEAN